MAKFSRLAVYNAMLDSGMVGLFYQADLAVAQQIVGALVDGGCRVIEFTNRGDFAIEVFSPLVKYCAEKHPDVIVGIGSVEDAATAALYLMHGANFVVGPTFSEEVTRLCNRRKIAYMPGCGTLNEIALAEEWGCEIVKVFPGMSTGGASFVKQVRGPRPWSSLMPTGGVTTDRDNLKGWFDAGVACVGMGSSLVKKDWVAAGDFDSIRDTAKSAISIIAELRADK